MVRNPPAKAGDARDAGLTPGSGSPPRQKARQPTPVSLPGEFQDRGAGGLQPMGSQSET